MDMKRTNRLTESKYKIIDIKSIQKTELNGLENFFLWIILYLRSISDIICVDLNNSILVK